MLPAALFVAGWFAAANQFAGHVKNYDITGEPLFIIFGKPVFNPVFYILSMFKYGIGNKSLLPYYTDSASNILLFSLIALAFAVAWSVITSVLFKSRKNLHGTARFARKSDLAAHGLLKKEGVVCGEGADAWVAADRKKDSALHMRLLRPSFLVCHEGTVNTIMLAGTGSGKGVSSILTTLNSYRHSAIVFDPKGENFERSAGWRSTFSRVLKFAPCSYDTVRFNPVMAVRDGDENAFRDADLLVSIFFTPAKAGEDSASQYFNENAKSLFTGALLHIRFSDYPDKSLAGLSKFLVNTKAADAQTDPRASQDGNADLGREECMTMMSTKHFYVISERMYARRRQYYDAMKKKVGDKVSAPEIDLIVSKAAAKAMNTNVKEKATVYATINSKLRLFDDPLIANATRGSDFEVEDFINSDVPISLYLVVPYSDISRIAFVFNLLINFMLKKFSEGETSEGSVRLKHHLLLLLDEFPVLGYFPEIAQNMGVLRGYGVHFFIIVQALSQLADIYGERHPFLNHCDIQIIGSPGDVKDAEHFSKTFGNETVHQGKVSRSGRARLTQGANLNFSDNDFGRALLDAADIMRLPDNRVIVYAKGMQPYVAKKCVYYMDGRFKNRASMRPPSMNDIFKDCAGLPSVQIRAARKAGEELRWKTMRAANNDAHMDEDAELFEDDEDGMLAAQALDAMRERTEDGAPAFGTGIHRFGGVPMGSIINSEEAG